MTAALSRPQPNTPSPDTQHLPPPLDRSTALSGPVTTAWTNGGIEDPEDYCDVAVPWCLLPYGHDGFCDDTPTPNGDHQCLT